MNDTTSTTNTDQLFYVHARRDHPRLSSYMCERVRAESALEALIHFLEVHDLDYDPEEFVYKLVFRYSGLRDWQGLYCMMDNLKDERGWLAEPAAPIGIGDIRVEKAPSGEIQTASKDCRRKARAIFEQAKEIEFQSY